MTTAVTGARGKVGRELVPLLTRAGLDVRALGRGTQPAFDLREPATWDAAVDGASSLFMLVPGGDDGHREIDEEANNATAFVDRAVAAGVERVVVLSALGIDHAPDDVWLRRLELHVQERAPSWTIVRPNWFFQNFTVGPLRDLIVAAGGELRVPLADAAVSYVDVRDVAEVCAAALADGAHVGREYDLTGPQALTPSEVADAMAAGGASAWRYRHLDEPAFRAEAAAFGWQDGYVDALCELFAAMRAGWAAQVTPDVEQVVDRPARDLATWVEDLDTQASRGAEWGPADAGRP